LQRTLSDLAQLCGAVLEGDGRALVRGPAALAEAGPDEISFYGHPRYRRELEKTRAAAVVVPRGLDVPRAGLTLLRCEDANRAFEKVVRAFGRAPLRPAPGVHPSAAIDPSASLGPEAAIAAHVTVGAGARIGARVALHPGVFVGNGVTIGDDTEVHANASLYDGVALGARCLVHAGAVIGADGFGFDPIVAEGRIVGWDKVPQCGTVVVEDEVEIGANSTIDRGRFAATRIRRGAKIDNLVHVGHNVDVGEHALLIAQVGISGSSVIGRGAILAGKVGVGPQIEIGAGARVSPGSGAFQSIPAGADYIGWWAMPRAQWLRNYALFKRLTELHARIGELEKRLAAPGDAGGAERER
jgi:UDP-3-O-[3-hydroxymyristoyl] glucosamine N-acyltransferase